MPMAEELEGQFTLAKKVFKKMQPCATHTVKMVTMELAQFAGSTAQMASQTQVSIVLSLPLMEEELAILATLRAKAITKILTVKSGAYSGTPNATKASTMLLAVCAVQTASMGRLILVSPVKS